MEKTVYSRIGEEVMWHTLPNGLPVCIVPRKGFERKYALFATRYGGMDLRFKLGEELVRVSPFDSAGRRQTSFASCDVMPEIEDDTEIEIRPEDIRIDTYRASGAGGQHVNKTSSAIRITHFPTGVVVACQEERSQFANKDKAFKMLKSKLLALKLEEQMQKLAEIRGETKEIGWGSQIRSYVFMPYTMVKDHRTGQETGKVDAVMDGDIDDFISAYLAWIHS